MSRENVEGMRADLEAFNQTGEINTARLAPDFELQQTSSIVDTAGTFVGREAFRDSLAELQESFEQVTVEGERFMEAPGGEIVALVRVRGRGRGSGLELDNLIAWVLTFRGEELVRLVIFEEPTEALEAVGLAE